MQISSTDGGVEMSWKVFAGENPDALASVIYLRAVSDGFADSPDGNALCLRAHLHRGLGYLASEKDINGISGFLTRWTQNRRQGSQ
jgi:DNA sulfur modification protein DndE